MKRYLSVAEVRDLGAMVLIAGYQCGIGIGAGRYFIPALPDRSGCWGFRQVRARRFWAWVWLRGGDALQSEIPGDILRCLETRNLSAIVQPCRC